MAEPSPEFLIVLAAAQGRLAPVVALSAPIPSHEAPLSWVNLPPTTTLPLPAGATMPSTSASAVGAQASSAPVLIENAARRERGWLPAVAKTPPT
jgi:hypothetical protein